MMDEASLGGRLPLLPPDGLGPAASALRQRMVIGRLEKAPFRSRTDAGALIGPFNALLHAPAIGAGFLDFHEAEERATPLSARLREVVILSVGSVWESAYELYSHGAAAARAGFPSAVVAALARGEEDPELSEEERSAQRFTLELTRNRYIREETYADCEGVLGRDRLIAVVFLAAAYLGTCTILNAFAVPSPHEASARSPV